MTISRSRYIAISGGIGGAKLALGLDKLLEQGQLDIIANTGDDFEHFGLSISPDVDTLLYTLAGLNNTELGWGRRDESWNFLEACKAMEMDTWFQLGDRDLAIHLYRTSKLAEGRTLSEITRSLCEKLNIQSNIIPMSNDPVRTMLRNDDGQMSFQEYFVKNKCEPQVKEIFYEGVECAEMSPAFSTALTDPNLKAIIICPSNPFLSIGPVLALRGLKHALVSTGKPVMLVSPVIEGQSVKGPTSKLMKELGLESSVEAIAGIHRDIITHIVIDTKDSSAKASIEKMGMEVVCMNILMNTADDKTGLAGSLLELAQV